MITILAGPDGAQLQAPRDQLRNASPLLAKILRDKPDTKLLYWNMTPLEYCRVYVHWISTPRRFQDLDVHMLTGWPGHSVPQSKKDTLIVVIPRLCQLWHYAHYFQDERLKSVIIDEIVASSSWKIPAETVWAFWTGDGDSKLKLLIFDYVVDTTTAQSFFEERDWWPPGLRDKMLWWMLAKTSSCHRASWSRGTRGDACRYHDHEKGACPLNDQEPEGEGVGL